jgi:hypothetical protein
MRRLILETIYIAALCVSAWAVLHFWVKTNDYWPVYTISVLIGMATWVNHRPVKDR